MNSTWQYIIDIGHTLLVIVLIVCLGLFAINQFFLYKYNVAVLASPCGVCAEKNPAQEQCIAGCFTTVTQAFREPLNISSNITFNFKQMEE
jgi:hypothetical protein